MKRGVINPGCSCENVWKIINWNLYFCINEMLIALK